MQPLLQWSFHLFKWGYYMAAWGYESVKKYFTSKRSERVRYFQHEKRNSVSPSGHAIVYLLYKHQWNTKPFHWHSFFPAKGAIYYVGLHSNGDIFTCENNMLFSPVKISCFRAKAHLVFHWCLYNKTCYFHVCEDIMFSFTSSPGISLV